MQLRIVVKLTLVLILSILVVSGCGTAQEEETTQPESSQEENTENNKTEGENQMSETKNPIVTITMENDQVIKAELYPEVAPNTVNNFISLIEKGYYDGVIFHRVIPGFMIQGGDPDGTGMGGPGYSIKGEFTANGFENNLKHDRGVLSMARTQIPDSAGSQFFIMVKQSPHLDNQYASFGKVIEGMEVADQIVNAKTDAMDKPLEDQKMKKVTVETFGVDYPEPEKIQ